MRTSSHSADHAASAGSVVTVLTKSGMNEFRGSAFEFLRDSDFDERNYVQLSNAAKPLNSTCRHNASVRGDVRPTDKDTIFARWSIDRAAFTALPARPVNGVSTAIGSFILEGTEANENRISGTQIERWNSRPANP